MSSSLLILLVLGQVDGGTPVFTVPASTEVVTAPAASSETQPQASSTVTTEPNAPPSDFRAGP